MRSAAAHAGDTVRVDLHCHSLASDAALSPARLADRLAEAGVAAAALTDHDTVDGLDAFQRRLSRHGIGFISGVEITCAYRDREIHLLAYGFQPAHPDLRDALGAIRRGQTKGAQSLADAVGRQVEGGAAMGREGMPHGKMDLADAIALVHRAGGKTFLAHPLAAEGDAGRLRELLVELKSIGLDGIEALYAPYAPAQGESLCRLAAELGLLVSAGSDWHREGGPVEPGMAMPAALWWQFRAAVCFAGAGGHGGAVRHALTPCDWLRFGLRIVMPVGLATGLFVAALFAVLLPAVEQALLERKREMIGELTHSACSILADYERQERSGRLTRAQAQATACERVKSLRYGREGKDYFWIQDLTPRMLMHPYRPDMDGQDLSTFRDARGEPIFVEFALLVQRQGQGYLKYVWQWQDDPNRLAPKESYVQGFAPWEWVVGTGMYVDDVRAQLAGIRENLVNICLLIVLCTGVVLGYLVWQSLRAERERADAEEALRESTERYRLLVEASTEGTLLVADGRCRYANPALRALLDYSEAQIALLAVGDVVPRGEERNRSAWEALEAAGRGEEPATGFDGVVRRRDGALVECMFSLSRIPALRGFILMAREVDPLRLQARGTGSVAGRVWEDWRVWVSAPGLRERNPAAHCRDVRGAATVEALAQVCRRTPQVAGALLAAGARAWHVTGHLAKVHDVAVARLTELAVAELGPAPCPFAFLALGSHGRAEPTLAADQDNALVYAGDAPEGAAGDYFAALGARVCNGLHAAGYPFCRGQMLAGNRRWCQPLGVWKRYFAAWIQSAEPRELMECSIFFDFRCAWGERRLADELWAQVQTQLKDGPAFLPRFAVHSLQFKPPLRLFGRTLGSGGEAPGTLNIKDVLVPVVGCARLYALRYGGMPTGTRDRLDELVPRGVLSPVVRADVDIVWDFLTRLRLTHQLEKLAAGQAPDSTIPDREWPAMEQAMLDQAFHRILALQKMVSHDFLGGA
jgi:CBS domain-containing protein